MGKEVGGEALSKNQYLAERRKRKEEAAREETGVECIAKADCDLLPHPPTP